MPRERTAPSQSWRAKPMAGRRSFMPRECADGEEKAMGKF
jgi:hypothetical protein